MHKRIVIKSNLIAKRIAKKIQTTIIDNSPKPKNYKIGEDIEIFEYIISTQKLIATARIIDINPIQIDTTNKLIFIGEICIKNQLSLYNEEVIILINGLGYYNIDKFWSYYSNKSDINNYKFINFKIV